MKNHRFKILYCIDNLACGGTELQLVNLINRLDRSRLEPHLLTLRKYDVEAFPVTCPHLVKDIPRIFSPSGIASVLSLAAWLRKNRIDAVQTFFQDATIVGGLAARLAGVPIRFASFRDMGFWRTGRHEWLLKNVYRMMTGYVANSDVVIDYFTKEFGLSVGKFTKIYNGADVTALPWVEHQGPASHVAIVGNLNRRVKRTDLFIKAAGILSPEFPEISWHVLGEGHYRAEYEELADSLGLGGRIVFAGNVDNVPAYLEQIQIGVNSSDSEGLSNALLEYMFKGCAVVATAVGGNSELVRDQETGLLVPPDDPEKLAAALRELIEKNELRGALAHNARLYAEETFSWEKCLAAHENLYIQQTSTNSMVGPSGGWCV